MQSAGSILSSPFFYFFFQRVVALPLFPLPPPMIRLRRRRRCSSSSLVPFREERKFGRRPISAKRIAAGSWEPLPCYYARRKGEVRHRLSIIRYIGNEFRNGWRGAKFPLLLPSVEEKFGSARSRGSLLFREDKQPRAGVCYTLARKKRTLCYYTGLPVPSRLPPSLYRARGMKLHTACKIPRIPPLTRTEAFFRWL